MAATGAVTCTAQGFYFKAGLGYAMPQATQSMDGTATPTSGTRTFTGSGTNTTAAYSIDKASFSTGLQGLVSVGYMFNKNVGIDLGLSLNVTTTTYNFTDYNVPSGSSLYDIQIIQKARSPKMLMPAVVMQTGGDMLNLYTRVGLALPLSTQIDQHQIFTNQPGNGAVSTQDFLWVNSNSFSLGFTAAAGVQYRLNNKVKIWGEASFLSLAMYIKEANLTDVTVDGATGYLTQIPVDERKVTFSKDFTAATNDYYHQPAFSQPFSNITIAAGVAFDLDHNSRSNEKGKNDVKGRRR